MKKIKIALVLCTSLLLSYMGRAQDLETQISVDFKIKNLGISVNGTFTDVAITTHFISDDLSQWALTGTVQVESINTGNKKRDKHLRDDDYFNVNRYPEIRLEATNFIKTAENKYDVTVDLTIKETTKSIVIPMEIIDLNDHLSLKAYFEINRRDYGVGGRSIMLSNTAKISVNYTLKKE